MTWAKKGVRAFDRGSTRAVLRAHRVRTGVESISYWFVAVLAGSGDPGIEAPPANLHYPGPPIIGVAIEREFWRKPTYYVYNVSRTVHLDSERGVRVLTRTRVMLQHFYDIVYVAPTGNVFDVVAASYRNHISEKCKY